jgi:glycosyltransferase involved in cell wall biosynthesis
MKISVLIPTYNRKELVCRALDRIFEFDHRAVHEVIVSDNHSDDDSYDYLKSKYITNPKIKVISPPEKCGPLKNWKYCLEHATGTHIHWHWSDDALISNFYNKAFELYTNSAHEVICGPVRISHEDGFSPVFYSQGFDRSMDSKTALNFLFTSGRLPYSPAAYILPRVNVIKHFYEDIPDYGELRPVEIAMGSDALMIAGALIENSSVGFCDEPIMEFRKHAGSITEQNIKSFRCYHLSFAFFIAKNKYEGISETEQKSIFGKDIYNLFNDDSEQPVNIEHKNESKKSFFSRFINS